MARKSLPLRGDATPLEVFMKTHGIKPAHVAREAGVSRQHLLRLRKARAEPTRAVMVAIADACSRLLRKRVQPGELFDLGSG